jgi:hypothetical protein
VSPPLAFLYPRTHILLGPVFGEQVNKSTLVVYKQLREEALNVRFANPRYVIVSGVFYKPGFGKLLVETNGVTTPDGTVSSGNSFGETIAVAFSFRGPAHN